MVHSPSFCKIGGLNNKMVIETPQGKKGLNTLDHRLAQHSLSWAWHSIVLFSVFSPSSISPLKPKVYHILMNKYTVLEMNYLLCTLRNILWDIRYKVETSWNMEERHLCWCCRIFYSLNKNCGNGPRNRPFLPTGRHISNNYYLAGKFAIFYIWQVYRLFIKL